MTVHIGCRRAKLTITEIPAASDSLNEEVPVTVTIAEPSHIGMAAGVALPVDRYVFAVSSIKTAAHIVKPFWLTDSIT